MQCGQKRDKGCTLILILFLQLAEIVSCFMYDDIDWKSYLNNFNIRTWYGYSFKMSPKSFLKARYWFNNLNAIKYEISQSDSRVVSLFNWWARYIVLNQGRLKTSFLRIGLVSRPLYTQEPNLFPPYKRKLQENFINLFVNTGSYLRAIQTKLNRIKYWMKWISKKLWKLYRMRYQYSIGPDNRLI